MLQADYPAAVNEIARACPQLAFRRMEQVVLRQRLPPPSELGTETDSPYSNVAHAYAFWQVRFSVFGIYQSMAHDLCCAFRFDLVL